MTDTPSRMRVRCACGWETTGSADEVVRQAQDHGRRLHNMDAPPEQILASASPADDDLRVVDNPAAHRYEALLGERVVAYSEYRVIGGRIVFLHTETDPEYEGRGIASHLVRGALDDVRSRGLRIRVKCPFVSAWLERHAGFEDLVAR